MTKLRIVYKDFTNKENLYRLLSCKANVFFDIKKAIEILIFDGLKGFYLSK